MRLLRKLSDWMNDACMVAGGITLVLMMSVACLNMILRLWGTPISATYEIVGYLGAVTVALPFGYAQRKRSHIAVDILSGRFPSAVRSVILTVSLLLGIGFFFVAAWQVGVHANTLWSTGEVSETLRIKYYPFTYAVAAACAIMAFSLFVELLELFFPPQEDAK
jgi:TRAP-type C4-dicarboxylate transport system permease small subunit